MHKDNYLPQVHSFSNRSKEQTLRLTSLDHLGVIAARLRKDVITSSEQDHEDLIEILSQVLQSKIGRRSPSPTIKMVCLWFVACTCTTCRYQYKRLPAGKTAAFKLAGSQHPLSCPLLMKFTIVVQIKRKVKLMCDVICMRCKYSDDR